MKNKYKIRHKILKELSDFFDKNKKMNSTITDYYIHTNEIIASFHKKYDEEEIWQNLEFLTETKEIGCTFKSKDSNFYILASGRLSYFDKKYLEIGANEFWTITYDRIKTIGYIILLFIAIYTFFANISQTKKNESDLNNIKIEIDKLKNQK